MRDSLKKSVPTQHDRRQAITSRKRQWLAACLMVTTISTTTIALGENHRPLLPLPTAGGNSDDVMVNPFCLPQNEGYDQHIALASNGKKPSVRLKKIGAAIGLHSIKNRSALHDPAPQILVEESPAGSIQSNPLAGAHENAPREKQGTTGKRGEKQGAMTEKWMPREQTNSSDQQVFAEQKSSKLVLMPLLSAPFAKSSVKQEDVVASGAEAVIFPEDEFQSIEPTDSNIESSGRNQAMEDQPLVDQPIVDQPTTGAATPTDSRGLANYLDSMPLTDPAETPEAQSEPIAFSLSDQAPSDPTSRDNVTSDSKIPDRVNSVLELPSAEETVAGPSTDEGPRIVNTDPAVIELAEPVENETVIGPEQRDDTETMIAAVPMEAMPNPKQNRFCQPAGTLMDTVVTEQEQLQSKRYRPPVAVHMVPLAIEGVTTDPTFQIEPVLDLGVTVAATPKERLVNQSKVTPLYLNRAQVRSLTLGARLRSVEVSNKDICQAFAAGPNQLKLIGTGSGVTRLVVWAEPVDGKSAPRVRSFDIHVKEISEEKGDSVEDKILVLNESIRDAFPDSDVVVHEEIGKIVVSGSCSGDANARKIVRMVRKTCLVAVEDQLHSR